VFIFFHDEESITDDVAHVTASSPQLGKFVAVVDEQVCEEKRVVGEGLLTYYMKRNQILVRISFDSVDGELASSFFVDQISRGSVKDSPTCRIFISA